MGTKGTVASAVALGVLLQEGIGDTIRVSLTPQPGEARTQEVVVALEILQAWACAPSTPASPPAPAAAAPPAPPSRNWPSRSTTTCARMMPVWKARYPGVENLKIAVMGCIVNGPGESKHADIGISLPGTGEAPAAPVFIDGEKALTLRGDGIAQEFHRIVETTSSAASAASPPRIDAARPDRPSRPGAVRLAPPFTPAAQSLLPVSHG
jgi:(E)-4-hydroxy-3-methylbut-2-enyl-diphosphate synthase